MNEDKSLLREKFLPRESIWLRLKISSHRDKPEKASLSSTFHRFLFFFLFSSGQNSSGVEYRATPRSRDKFDRKPFSHGPVRSPISFLFPSPIFLIVVPLSFSHFSSLFHFPLRSFRDRGVDGKIKFPGAAEPRFFHLHLISFESFCPPFPNSILILKIQIQI